MSMASHQYRQVFAMHKLQEQKKKIYRPTVNDKPRS
jgi:hypothetical protein